METEKLGLGEDTIIATARKIVDVVIGAELTLMEYSAACKVVDGLMLLRELPTEHERFMRKADAAI